MDNRTMDQLTDAERADLIKQRCLILEQELARVKHDLEEAKREEARAFKEWSELKKSHDILDHMYFTTAFIGGVCLFFALVFCVYAPDAEIIALLSNPLFFVGSLLGMSAFTLLVSYIVTIRVPIIFSIPAETYRGKHHVLLSVISTFIFTVLLYAYYFWRISL